MPTHLNTKGPNAEYDVSVIIPTYNRHSYLLETLESLAQQTLAASRFEVVIVDDGSTDATPQIAGRPYPFHVNFVRQHNQGGVFARNRGAEVSVGELLVFIDDDISFDPGYLQAILDGHQLGHRLISMGTFQPYLTGHDTAFAVLNARQVVAKLVRHTDQEVLFTECTSNNLAIEREDFFDVGIWQEALEGGPGIWGDVEFGYRAWQQGFKFLRIADARLYHRDRHAMSLQAACKRAYHVSRTVQLLFQKHPELAQHLAMFRDKQPLSLLSDSPGLVIHKIFHTLTSCPPGLWSMERLAHIVETKAPESRLLEVLYRWIVSAYIFRGYRQGLRDLAEAQS